MTITPEQLAILRSKRGSGAGRKTSLNDEAVTAIRKSFWVEKKTAALIAAAWNLSKTAVSSIVNGKTYKHVPFPPEWFEEPHVEPEHVEPDEDYVPYEFEE